MTLPPAHPMLLGPAILHRLKEGKLVEKITVWFTHGQLHHLFSPAISDKFPLEMTLAEGMDMEQKIDCRLFQAPWNIDVRTDEQKQQANRAKAEPAPKVKPPEPPTAEEQSWHDQLFASSHALYATEFRLLQQQQRREAIRKAIRQQRDQPQPADTPHG